MNSINFGFSLKNIPLTSKYNYIKQLTEKVEDFIKRLRWKAYFFKKADRNNDNNEDNNSNFWFKTNITPPQHNMLI